MTPPNLPREIDSLIITYTSRQHAFKDDYERRLIQWYACIECTDDDGESVEEVGYILAYTVDFEEMSDPFSLLDAETADLGHIAGVLFDPSTGELVDELDDLIEPFGSGVLIIDSVRLKQPWRGHGVGPLVVGMAIQQLGEGRRMTVLRAAPTERRNSSGEVVERSTDADRAVAVAKLGALWSQLGFEHVRDEVWVLDHSLTTFSQAMQEIRRRFGLGS